MRYTIAIAAAFAAGAAASYAPTYDTGYDVDSYDDNGNGHDDDGHDDDCDGSYDGDCNSSVDPYPVPSYEPSVDPYPVPSYEPSVDPYPYSSEEHSSYMTKDPEPTDKKSTYYYKTTDVHYKTEVVKTYETYCPHPTTYVHADKTYTVTKAQTLTITDCPCTVTKPVKTVIVTDCPKDDCPTDKVTFTDKPEETTTVKDTLTKVDTRTVIGKPDETDVDAVPEETKVDAVPEETKVDAVPEETKVTDVDAVPVDTGVPAPVDTDVAPFPAANTTAPTGTGEPVPTASVFEGAASRTSIFSGAALAAVLAVAAFL